MNDLLAQSDNILHKSNENNKDHHHHEDATFSDF